ncbi:unnamed protein product [Sphenostylis stenocarpa]|uniref:Uncharacterized protein n=1 Tax=Sphenostylis stenocarpa TaxID=92480 RepID=A0AA86RTU2_9FABA|nr:unnamed protein product [Sphenostylis stenocarpa]
MEDQNSLNYPLLQLFKAVFVTMKTRISTEVSFMPRMRDSIAVDILLRQTMIGGMEAETLSGPRAPCYLNSTMQQKSDN